MIKVTRINNSVFYVNADLIEFVEETPDTVITLATGRKVVVSEPAEAVVEKVVDYRKQAFFGLPPILKPRDIDAKD